MNKKVLGVAMVVVFCGILWLVMGEAMQAYNQAKTLQYASTEIAVLNLNIAAAHIRLQAAFGIGAGLLADVLILVGVLAWQKITFKS
jgi:hypothetical protein